MDINNIRINLFDILKSISGAQDLFSPIIYNHQEQVAYLSYQIARELDLSTEEIRDIFLAGMVHDIGALSSNERLELVERQAVNVNNHAFVGTRLLEKCRSLYNIGKIIKFHHIPWNNGKGEYYKGEVVGLNSHIIHLADSICTMINKNENVLSQMDDIMTIIKSKSAILYNPIIVSAVENLRIKEYIWLDLISDRPTERVDVDNLNMPMLDIDDLVDITVFFSRIIDFRSKFTARHSAGVANVSALLAKLCGFCEVECKMILVAGYLHDLGKLAISNEILEKNGKLTKDEFNYIKMHTYYTYELLIKIPYFEEIAKWAAYHHEKLDGTGYPFHIKGEELSLGSRIMAVSDVFTAIMEDRPYRLGMSNEQAINILKNMVSSNALDEKIVDILFNNFETIKSTLIKSQIKASKDYEDYSKIQQI